MRTLATFRSRRARLGRLERLSAQHPPFTQCARCHVYTFRYRWRSELRSGGPDLEWGGCFACGSGIFLLMMFDEIDVDPRQQFSIFRKAVYRENVIISE